MQKPTSEQKERLKKARQEAYRKMKEKRDRDPHYIALKEAQKEKRKELSQNMRKLRTAEKEARKMEARKKRDEQLFKMITRAGEITPKH